MTKRQKINIRVPFLFMASLLIFSLIAMISCEKDNLLEKQNTVSVGDSELAEFKDIKPTGDGDGGGNGDGPILDCPNLKKRVYQEDGMLVFQNEEHLWQCADCLELDYQAYNDAYESQYPNATAEELDRLDELNNFNDWQPFIDFENSKNHSSLRARIERAIVAWEDNTPIDQINDDDDPDDSTIILHENVRALFNERGMAKVGGKVISEDFFGDPGGIRVQDACAWGYSEKHTFDQSDDPNLVNRQIKIKVAVHSGLTRSKLKGKITHKRRRNGRMKRTRAHIRVGVIGRGMSDGGFGQECDISAQWWNRGAGSYKKRKTRRNRSRIWGLWREAVVDNSHPQWNFANRCRARGEWNDASQTYNLFLGD